MEQLEKVLALVDSSHEGEALGALRMARRILAKNGLSFKDLACSAGGGFSLRSSFFSPTQAQLESKIEQLQDDLDAHVEQNQSLSTQMEFWRARARELEQSLTLQQAETSRWKTIARETAEKLWDIGQIARAEAALSQVVPEEKPPVQEGVPEVKKTKAAGRRAAK